MFTYRLQPVADPACATQVRIQGEMPVVEVGRGADEGLLWPCTPARAARMANTETFMMVMFTEAHRSQGETIWEEQSEAE